MRTALLPLHIVAAVLALVFGYVALFAAKGAPLHRKAGMLFVYTMVLMSLSAVYIAAIASESMNVIAGLVTFYFVTTGMLTVRRARTAGWVHLAGVAVALLVGLLAFGAGREMALRGRPEAAPLFIFGVVSMLGAAGDTRVIRNGGIEGRARLKRHLWRMCFAMWVAAASFFWGPPNRVPEMIRYPMFSPIPVLAPTAVMLYWLWKMRGKTAVRGVVVAPRHDQTTEVSI